MSTSPVNPTPRTNALNVKIMAGEYAWMDAYFMVLDLACELERELSATPPADDRKGVRTRGEVNIGDTVRAMCRIVNDTMPDFNKGELHVVSKDTVYYVNKYRGVFDVVSRADELPPASPREWHES